MWSHSLSTCTSNSCTPCICKMESLQLQIYHKMFYLCFNTEQWLTDGIPCRIFLLVASSFPGTNASFPASFLSPRSGYSLVGDSAFLFLPDFHHFFLRGYYYKQMRFARCTGKCPYNVYPRYKNIHCTRIRTNWLYFPAHAACCTRTLSFYSDSNIVQRDRKKCLCNYKNLYKDLQKAALNTLCHKCYKQALAKVQNAIRRTVRSLHNESV